MAAVLESVDADRATVLVTHGDAMRMALAHLAGRAPQDAEWVEVSNGAVARVAGDGAVTWLGRSAPPGQ